MTHDLDDAESVLGDRRDGIGAEIDAWLARQHARRRERVSQALVAFCNAAERAGLQRLGAAAWLRMGEASRGALQGMPTMNGTSNLLVPAVTCTRPRSVFPDRNTPGEPA